MDQSGLKRIKITPYALFVLCLFFICPGEIPGRPVSGLVVMSAEKTTPKKQLRREMSARRRDLERHWAAAASARICRHIVRHSVFKFARRQGVYLAKDNEADLSALLRSGAAFNKEFLLSETIATAVVTLGNVLSADQRKKRLCVRTALALPSRSLHPAAK